MAAGMIDATELSEVRIKGIPCRRFLVGRAHYAAKRVRMWRRAPLMDHRRKPVAVEVPAGRGSKTKTVRAYYLVKDLVVSPRHNGGMGFSIVDGRPHYSGEFWEQHGWKPIDQIPSDWKEQNALLDAEKQRRAEKDFENTPAGKMQARLSAQQKSLEALVQHTTGLPEAAPDV